MHRPFFAEFMQRIRRVVDPAGIDCLAMNDAEPDHAGPIPEAMAAAPNAELLATEMGVEMAKILRHVPTDKAAAVQESDAIGFGGKTLKFLSAPWLHWPETMFTFAVEDAVLFSCDFLSVHLASDVLFPDEVGGLVLPEAKLCYAVILMPYAKMSCAGLDKAVSLMPRITSMIHGAIWRNPEPTVDAYREWPTERWPARRSSPLRQCGAARRGWPRSLRMRFPDELSVTDLARLARELVN